MCKKFDFLPWEIIWERMAKIFFLISISTLFVVKATLFKLMFFLRTWSYTISCYVNVVQTLGDVFAV